MKTHFSFDVYYPSDSDGTQAQQGQVMESLGPALQKLLAARDAAATVAVSDSHKGRFNKLVELTTTLQDAQITEVLKSFSEQHGVTVTALE